MSQRNAPEERLIGPLPDPVPITGDVPRGRSAGPHPGPASRIDCYQVFIHGSLQRARPQRRTPTQLRHLRDRSGDRRVIAAGIGGAECSPIIILFVRQDAILMTATTFGAQPRSKTNRVSRFKCLSVGTDFFGILRAGEVKRSALRGSSVAE